MRATLCMMMPAVLALTSSCGQPPGHQDNGNGNGNGDDLDSLRVLLMFQSSVSLQCTDPNLTRYQLISDKLEEMSGDPRITVSLMRFSNSAVASAFDEPEKIVIDPADDLGPAADYQGALTVARRLIEEDAETIQTESRARTRYQVLLYGNGIPSPVCAEGCEDNDRSLCNLTERPSSLDDAEYADFTPPCPEYNSSELLVDRVASIVALQESLGLDRVSLDTFFVFAETETIETFCPGAGELFGYSWNAGVELLEAMAAAGGGSFVDLLDEERGEPVEPGSDPANPPYECDGRFDDCGGPPPPDDD